MNNTIRVYQCQYSKFVNYLITLLIQTPIGRLDYSRVWRSVTRMIKESAPARVKIQILIDILKVVRVL